jgi:hypothetical protein
MTKRFVIIMVIALLGSFPALSSATQLSLHKSPTAGEIESSNGTDWELLTDNLNVNRPTKSARITYWDESTYYDMDQKESYGSSTTLSMPVIPEPASAFLTGLGIIGLGAYRKLRR